MLCKHREVGSIPTVSRLQATIKEEGDMAKRKAKLYIVSYEIYEYGEEFVRAHSKKEAIAKVKKSPQADCGGSNFTAEVCGEDQEETL